MVADTKFICVWSTAVSDEWMKICLNLPEHPKVFQLSILTGITPDAVVGKLIKVWRWAHRHTTDGVVHTGVTPPSHECNAPSVTQTLQERVPERVTPVYNLLRHFDEHVSHPGFTEAMLTVGWLVIDSGNIVFPEFDKHNSSTAKSRALNNSRVSRYRKKATKEPVSGNATVHAPVTLPSRECNAPSVTPTLQERVPERERERELNPPTPQGGGDGEKNQNTNPAAIPATDGELIPTAAQIATWQSNFPGIDVQATLERGRRYLIDTPDRRRPVAETIDFIVAMFATDQATADRNAQDERSQRREHKADPLPSEITPAFLATEWTFFLMAKKNGRKRDTEADVAVEITAWIDAGFRPEDILAEIRAKRDRSEHLWQFKNRLAEAVKERRIAEALQAEKQRRREEMKRLADEVYVSEEDTVKLAEVIKAERKGVKHGRGRRADADGNESPESTSRS